MLPPRERVLAEARTWVGTPFVHRQRKKGLACDCLGLVWGVGEGAGVVTPLSKQDVASFWPFYGRRPDPPIMREALSKFLVRIEEDEAGPGDIVWMHWDNFIPVHVAIIGDYKGRRTLIHAVLDLKVVEHGLAAQWPGRVDSFWRYPGVANG